MSDDRERLLAEATRRAKRYVPDAILVSDVIHASGLVDEVVRQKARWDAAEQHAAGMQTQLFVVAAERDALNAEIQKLKERLRQHGIEL